MLQWSQGSQVSEIDVSSWQLSSGGAVDSMGVHRCDEHGKQGMRERAAETPGGANLFNSLRATIHSASTAMSMVVTCKAAIHGIPAACEVRVAIPGDEPRSGAACTHRGII